MALVRQVREGIERLKEEERWGSRQITLLLNNRVTIIMHTHRNAEHAFSLKCLRLRDFILWCTVWYKISQNNKILYLLCYLHFNSKKNITTIIIETPAYSSHYTWLCEIVLNYIFILHTHIHTRICIRKRVENLGNKVASYVTSDTSLTVHWQTQ